MKPRGCWFPPDAPLDRGIATVQVSLDAKGAITSILLVNDPGGGLGRAAEACVAGGAFEPASDEREHPVTGKLVLPLRFER